MIPLPDFAGLDRTLAAGEYGYVTVLPRIAESPALARVAPQADVRARLLERARIEIREGRGYAFVDVEAPCIVLSEWYYREGGDLDLYLDLLHELAHLRQLEEGLDLWDERFEYVDRPTEIEGYTVAIEEGRRLGMTDEDVLRHLNNPWMRRLLGHVDGVLAGGELPNIALARQAAPRKSRRPW